MSHLTLSYILAMVIVVLILVILAIVQNWWDAYRGR